MSEYPKSGGTWIVSLLGDALGVAKRDIYVSDSYRSFDIRKHPWYVGAADLDLTDTCVIKSHELPESTLLRFPKREVHLVRDGRDVVVSKYFFERDFCVANGIYTSFSEPFDDYVPRVAAEWSLFVLTWLDRDVPVFKYEEFLSAPVETLGRLLVSVGLKADKAALHSAVENNCKEKLRGALDMTFEHNTFVRRAVAGDWRNHFQRSHMAVFDKAAGDVLERLGYPR